MNATEIFQKTSQRITEKLAKFEKLLRDPELAPYVAALKNGELPGQRQQKLNGRKSTTQKSMTQKSALRKSAAQSVTAKKSTRQKAGAPNGVRDAIRSLKGHLPANFTVEDIVGQLRRKKFGFTSRKPVKALSNTLFKLAQKREIKLVKAGAGGKSNTYTWSAKK